MIADKGGAPGAPTAARRAPGSSRGFVLLLSLLMLMGIGAMAVGMMVNAKHGQVSAQNHKNRIRAFYASDGICALLAQEVLDGNAGRYLDAGYTEEIEGEIWENVPGNRLADLKAAMKRPPTRKITSTYLGARPKNKFNYGVRWKGYVIPPITGSYTFMVRVDDAAAFYLSTDETAAKLSANPIAFADNALYGWPQSGTAISKPVTLKAGKYYYFELLHKQGALGEGFGQVAWKGPNYLVERPIPGPRIARVGSLAQKWDTASLGKEIRIKYALRSGGLLTYNLATEAMLGGPGDTAYRAPLNQTLSLLGDTPEPPATIAQKVIYYDFHSDGSNPEFERFNPGSLGVKTGMVRQKGLRYEKENADYFGLDSIGKPVLGPSPFYNCGVDKWFNPWNPGWLATYAYAGGPADCRATPSGTDHAFHNMVFKDAIQFQLRKDLGANVYQFRRLSTAATPAGFMPLNGKGFGAEGFGKFNGNNYSFCMELHTQFEHTSGMVLEFNGDDDVWMYVNDSLVMDIGGVHGSEFRSVVLDDLDLKFGRTYNLDFFYCERHTFNSSIDLIMNMPILQVKDQPRSSWRRQYGTLD